MANKVSVEELPYERPSDALEWHADMPDTSNYTGWILERFKHFDQYRHYVNGSPHRDLGPAILYFDGDRILYVSFYIDGNPIPLLKTEYWGRMALKYKGTEHEALCLAYTLGAT